MVGFQLAISFSVNPKQKEAQNGQVENTTNQPRFESATEKFDVSDCARTILDLVSGRLLSIRSMDDWRKKQTKGKETQQQNEKSESPRRLRCPRLGCFASASRRNARFMLRSHNYAPATATIRSQWRVLILQWS
jgi:hypothetical protein